MTKLTLLTSVLTLVLAGSLASAATKAAPAPATGATITCVFVPQDPQSPDETGTTMTITATPTGNKEARLTATVTATQKKRTITKAYSLGKGAMLTAPLTVEAFNNSKSSFNGALDDIDANTVGSFTTYTALVNRGKMTGLPLGIVIVQDKAGKTLRSLGSVMGVSGVCK